MNPYLPPTSGKTPAGNAGLGQTDARDRPAPKPVPAKPPVAPKGKTPAPKPTNKPSNNAGQSVASPGDPFGVMSSLQPALQALSSQQQAQLAQQGQQRQAIQDATNQFLKYVQGQPSVVNDYTQAAQTEGNLANSASQFLQQANPTDAINAVLSKLSPLQAAQVAGQLSNVYNGGAAALNVTRGLIPGNLLSEEGANAAAFQKSQLPNVALQGINNLKQFAYNANTANQALAAKKADLLAQIPGLTQKAQATAAAQAAKTAYENAQLGLSQQRINATIADTNARLANSNAQFNARQTQQQNQFIARQRASIAKFNAQQKNAAAKLKLPSASLSRANGYMTATDGSPIRDAKGNLQVLPGFKATQNGGVVKTTKVSSSTNNLSASSVQSFVHGLSVNKKDPKTGKAMLYPDGTPVIGHKMQYMAAYKYLRSRGVSDVDARTALDTTYKKGQDGRAWLTNEEQAVIRRSFVGLGSKRPAKALVYTDPKSGQKLGYLTPNQFQILQQAGVAPLVHPGAPNGGLWIDPNG